MEEQNYKTSPKISFLLGLFVGLAVIGLVGFFVTLPRAISCDIEEAKVAVIDTGIENNEVVPGNDNDRPQCVAYIITLLANCGIGTGDLREIALFSI